MATSVAGSARADEVIEISGEAPSEAEEGEPVAYEVTPEDIRRVAGSGNDALRALQSLPGVARVPFGMGGLVVRGLGPRSTNVYLDGIEVPQLFHFGGLASFFPTALLRDIKVEPGGFGVEHGRALGGVVSLRSREARGDRFRVSSELGLLDVSVRGEGPGPGGTAVLISARRSYIDQVLPLFTSDEELGLTLAPRYYDAQLRIDVPRPPGQDLSLVVFGADDEAGFEVDVDGFERESFEYRARFLRAGLPWRVRRGATATSLVPYVGIDRFSLVTQFQDVRRSGALFGLRTHVEHASDTVDTRVGAEVRAEHADLRARTYGTNRFTQVERDGWTTDAGLWAEALIRLADGRILAKPGLRVDRFGQSDEWVVEPRINVSHLFPHGIALRESIGVYHEPPVTADELWGNELRSSYAVQGTVSVDASLPYALVAQVTGFYTELYRLPADTRSEPTNMFSNVNPWEGGAVSSSREFISEQFGTFSEQASVGRGRAYGIEAMARRATPTTLAWVAYTISQSERRDDRHEFAAELPYILDQTHVLSVVGSRKLGAWFLGARARYATGNPITTIVDTRVTPNGPVANFSVPLSGRLPAFFQVDARVERTWKLPRGVVRAFLEVTNLTNRLNPEGIVYNYDFSESEYTRGLPILPAFGVEYAE